MNNKRKPSDLFIIGFLVILLVAIIIFISFDLTPYHTEDYYTSQFNQTYIAGASQGIVYGSQNTVATIVAIAKDCKEVPLVFEDKTYNLWWPDGCGAAP